MKYIELLSSIFIFLLKIYLMEIQIEEVILFLLM